MIKELIQNKNTKERAKIKSTAISKIDFFGEHINIKYNIEIDIQSIKDINGGIEIAARAWKNNKQLGFGKDGTIEIERFRIYNPPILVDDDNGDIIKEYYNNVTKKHEIRKLKEDPKQAVLETLAHIISVVGKENTNIIKGKTGNTTSTFYPDAHIESTSVDGWTARDSVNETFAAIRSNAGTNSDDDGTGSQNQILIQASGTTNQYQQLYRSYYLFDTSALPDTDTIDSATISFYGKAKDSSLGGTIKLDHSVPASDTALVSADYNIANHDGVSQSDTALNVADWVLDGFNTLTLNSTGKGNISKTGISKFALRISFDLDNSAPTWIDTTYSYCQGRMAEEAGTSEDPKLIVVHSAAATTSSSTTTSTTTTTTSSSTSSTTTTTTTTSSSTTTTTTSSSTTTTTTTTTTSSSTTSSTTTTTTSSSTTSSTTSSTSTTTTSSSTSTTITTTSSSTTTTTTSSSTTSSTSTTTTTTTTSSSTTTTTTSSSTSSTSSTTTTTTTSTTTSTTTTTSSSTTTTVTLPDNLRLAKEDGDYPIMAKKDETYKKVAKSDDYPIISKKDY